MQKMPCIAVFLIIRFLWQVTSLAGIHAYLAVFLPMSAAAGGVPVLHA